MVADLGFPPDDHEIIRRPAEGVERQVHWLHPRQPTTAPSYPRTGGINYVALRSGPSALDHVHTDDRQLRRAWRNDTSRTGRK
jgi:hypothetical protein